MKTFRQLLKEFKLHYGIISSFLGIALMIDIFILFKYPRNQYLLLSAFVLGGLMNILNGLNTMKNPKRKNMGMSYLLMGLILIFIGMIMSVFRQTFS